MIDQKVYRVVIKFRGWDFWGRVGTYVFAVNPNEAEEKALEKLDESFQFDTAWVLSVKESGSL